MRYLVLKEFVTETRHYEKGDEYITNNIGEMTKNLIKYKFIQEAEKSQRKKPIKVIAVCMVSTEEV